MKFHCFIIFLVLLLSACNSTLFIKNDDASFNQLNKRLWSEEVTIELASGKTIYGYINKIKPDTVYINRRKISTEGITKIIHSDYSKGALNGLLYGIIFGATTAGLNLLLNSGGKMLEGIASLYFITLGPMIGVISGLSSSKDIYVFPLTNQSSSKVEFSSILESNRNSIKILWENKEISLLRSEYSYGGKTESGKHYLYVKNEIHSKKFK